MSKGTRDALWTLLDAAWNRFMDHECETPCEKCRSASDLMERGEQELALLRQTNADLLEALKDMGRVSGLAEPAARRASWERAMAVIAKAEGR